MKKKAGNAGWSTRYKYKSLPKYVYLWQVNDINKRLKTQKPFRVCKKVKGKTVTLGYYKTLKRAKEVASLLY